MKRTLVGRASEKRPHVALLVETTLESGRDILRGIAKYSAQKGPWSIYHEPRGLYDEAPDWLSRWDGDGIIARIQTPQIAEAVRRSGIPSIDVLGAVEKSKIPLVHVDHEALVHMAADHLYERGYRHFAFCGLADQNWSRMRSAFFEYYLAGKGHSVQTYDHVFPKREAAANWEIAQNQLSSWLYGLKKPVGILVCSDQIGTHVMDACRRSEIHVPDEAGVIGIDNDEPLCMVCDPPMTSINAAHQEVGYQAAMMLHKMMSGKKRSIQPIAIKPASIICRRSTEVLTIGDASLVRALRFITDYGCKGINVDAVAKVSGVSRSVLQRRFSKLLGRTVHEELLRVKLHKAEELLATTSLPILEIAEIAGFNHQEYMGVVFMKRLGVTPSVYRKSHKFS